MTLSEYIQLLKKFDPDLKLEWGLKLPHSWRGNPKELAFQPVSSMTIGEMLKSAEECIGTIYEGLLGGEFQMNLDTQIHIDYMGNATRRESDYVETWLQGVIGTALFIHIKNA